MDHFELTPDAFDDLDEAQDTSGFFSTRAGFIASKEVTPGTPLNMAWTYDGFIYFRAFALTVTVTP